MLSFASELGEVRIDGVKRKAAELEARRTVPRVLSSNYADVSLLWDGGSTAIKMAYSDNERSSNSVVNVMVLLGMVKPAMALTKKEFHRLHYVNLDTIYAQGGSAYEVWGDLVTRCAEECFVVEDGNRGGIIRNGQLFEGSKKKCLLRLPHTASEGVRVALDQANPDEDESAYAIFPRCDGVRSFPDGDQHQGNGFRSFFRRIQVAIVDIVDDEGYPKIVDLRLSYDFVHAVCVRAVWLMKIQRRNGVFFCYPNHLKPCEYYTQYSTIYHLAFGDSTDRLVGISESDATILGVARRQSESSEVLSVDFGGAFTLLQHARVDVSDGRKKVTMIKKVSLPVGQQTILCRMHGQAMTRIQTVLGRLPAGTIEASLAKPQVYQQFLAMVMNVLASDQEWENGVLEFARGRNMQPKIASMPTQIESTGIRVLLDFPKAVNTIAQFISHVLIIAEYEKLLPSRIKIVPVGTSVWNHWFRGIFDALLHKVMGDRRYEVEYPPAAGGRDRGGAAGTLDGLRELAKLVDNDGTIDFVREPVQTTLIYTNDDDRVETVAFDSDSNAVTLPDGISFITINIPDDKRVIKESTGKAQGYTKDPTDAAHWAEFVRTTRKPQMPYLVDTPKNDHYASMADTLILAVKGGGRIESVDFNHDHVVLVWGSGRPMETIPMYDDRVLIVSSDSSHSWLRLYNKMDLVAGLCGDDDKADRTSEAFRNLRFAREKFTANDYTRITEFMKMALEAYPNPEHWEPFFKPAVLKFGYDPRRDDEAAKRVAFPNEADRSITDVDQYEQWMLMSATRDINGMFE
jgi:hypothetical protein